MTPRRQHMITALQRRGKGERTPASSVREVRLLAQCSHPSPDRLSAQALQRLFSAELRAGLRGDARHAVLDELPPDFGQWSDLAQDQYLEVRTLPLVWHLPSPDGVFEACSRGGVRTSAVLRAQTPAALEKIRAAVRDSAAGYARSDGSCEIPMPAVLASATRE